MQTLHLAAKRLQILPEKVLDLKRIVNPGAIVMLALQTSSKGIFLHFPCIKSINFKIYVQKLAIIQFGTILRAY
jgi:hypothetical protein